MNTMNIPGFTAEASIYQKDEGYHTTRALDAPTDGKTILPQMVCSYSGGARCCCVSGYCTCDSGHGTLQQ